MSSRYSGGVVRKNQLVPNTSSASGVWNLSEATQATKSDIWPYSGIANPISQSLRFRDSASPYLIRTPAGAGNRRTWTWSGWVKRGGVSGSYNDYIFSAKTGTSERDGIYFNTSDFLGVFANDGNGAFLLTTQVFRDFSAWYHIVVSVDTTNATANNRIRVYVNGVEITAFGTRTNPTLNYDWAVNNTVVHTFGDDSANVPTNLYHFNGYMAEVHHIDGQALTPSSFGQTSAITGVWEPKQYTGTYGTNGFRLEFKDTSVGHDTSGNNRDWTPNNFSTTLGATYDLMTDVPTQWAPRDGSANVRGNYATLNPLDAQGTATLSDANLTLASSSTTHRNRKATFVVPSTGKWYWELTTASTCSASVILGWGLQTTSAATDSQAGNANTFMAQNDANQDIWNQTTSVLSTGSAVAGGSIRQVAYDADTGKIWFGINNTWYSSTDLTSGNPSAGTNQCLTLSAGSYFPTITCYNLTANANFGQRPFVYTPPSGFKALCTTNLPTPTIGATTATAANKYFDATLITGTAATQVITNAGGFQPDFVWLKSRTNANNPTIYDAIRGVNTLLYPALTNAEAVGSAQLTAFNSNGFTLGASENANDSNGEASVGWQWNAGGSTVTNTAGSISSQVRANPTAGFSIVTYTGNNTASTVGHGLGVAPSMYIVKLRSTTGAWGVYHESITASRVLYLNVTDGDDGSVIWNSTAPTSSVFSVGAHPTSNPSGQTLVAYCFAPVAGYSAFGSYTGNGSSDGPFIFTGFRPRFVMFKRTNSIGNWWMIDTSRSSFNQMADVLLADSSGAEFTSGTGWPGIDYLSNGFKLRGTAGGINASGSTYIYMAFAEHPFKNSLAR